MSMRFLFLMLIPCLAHSQAVDTIAVTTDKTVYALFDTEVILVDLGTKLDYANQVKENIVMLKALRENVKPTSLLIKTKSDIFVWIIKYQKEPPALRVDTRKAFALTKEEAKLPVSLKSVSKSEAAVVLPVAMASDVSATEKDKYLLLEPPVLIRQRTEVSNRDVVVKDALMQGKIYSLLAKRQNYKDMGEISNGIYFSLHDLAVDKQYLYVKMALFNTSSIAFDLDVMYFERNQGKTLKKREAYASKNIPSVFHESVFTVQPSHEEIVVFVLDLFAYQDKDKLMVKVNERGGVRSLQFYIPAKSVVNAKSM